MTPGGSALPCRHPSMSWASLLVSAGPPPALTEAGARSEGGLCTSGREGFQEEVTAAAGLRVSVRTRGVTPVALAVASAQQRLVAGSWAALRWQWEPSKGRFEGWVGAGRLVD